MQTLLKKKDLNSLELASLLEAREKGKIDFLLVDVREDVEYKMGHIKGVDILHPTTLFEQWGQKLFSDTQDKTVVFTCRTGNRSGRIANMFAKNGHENAINHYGGIVTYTGEIIK